MKSLLASAGLLAAVSTSGALDNNANQQSDVWEMIHGVSGLGPAVDSDKDGFSNAAESLAGTNPLDPLSYPAMSLSPSAPGSLAANWWGLAGKRYTLQTRPDLSTGNWSDLGSYTVGQGAWAQFAIPTAGAPQSFFRLNVTDQDSDGDGVTDWEERAIGFDPTRNRTERFSQLDDARVVAGLSAPSVITVSVYDDTFSERWPDPALLVVRRSGGLRALTVNVTFSGTATRGSDYTTAFAGNTVAFAPGQREAMVELQPVADAADAETDETIILTATAGTGYTLGAETSATATLKNETASSLPSAKGAARFLIQAAFGPDQDSPDDADHIPENVEEVMALGYEAWITQQFGRPVGTLRPFVQWAKAQPGSAEIYNDTKQDAWWGRVMGLPKLRPDAVATQLPDPLRQRVGYALSQIFVISDRMEAIGVDREGMAAYYDMLLTHSLGNFRDLLFDVAVHPCMGLYLSHIGNRKYNPVTKTFPDENFAREVMQLFSIGLWMLNPDGTLQKDGNDQPIPTYSNADITEFARVFTGLACADKLTLTGDAGDLTLPMKGWDFEHDLGPKTLLLGVTTPARTASPSNTGTATMADINAAVDNLFNHPNVGPFISKLLIQRLITSNPSHAYIGRVAAAFANNGSGVRGDMKAVVRAIYMDDEARNPAMLADPGYGKLREPMLKCVNFARAFNAISQEGWYYLDAFILDHVQEPMKSPSVFNFYLPTYSPPGLLAQAGLVAPEFQIINATSGVTAPNYYWTAIISGLHRWGTARPERNTKLNLTQEMLMNVPAANVNDYDPNVAPLDPDPLLRRLDLALTGGTLSPRNFQIIREAMQRVGPGIGDWPRNRLRLAIYLIVTSPEFSVQR